MDREEFEQTMIALALAGDTEEARYALSECARGVLMGTLSQRMRTYLHDRLREVVEGMKPARALRIARAGAGRPHASREWEVPLAALAALLTQRGWKGERFICAMNGARQIIERKDLDETEAKRIRREWRGMREMDGDHLKHVMLHRRPRGTVRADDGRVVADEPRSLGSVPRFPEATALALLALLDTR